MYEIIFLFTLAFIWIVFATVQDLKKREVANWLNFSLIIFALGFRFFYSLFSGTGFRFFYEGLIGLGIFFILGNLLYYGKLFAGGDAKLMIALGAVLPFSMDLFLNLRVLVFFLFVFFIVGAVYSLIVSLIFSLVDFKNFKKKFASTWNKSKKLIYPLMVVGIIFMLFGFFHVLSMVLGIFLFLSPYFYIYAKAVDEACMVRRIPTSRLAQGDWLYKDLKIGKRVIKATWEGLKKEEIIVIKKNRKFVLTRQGIPFTPVFLISFLFFIYLFWTGLWNSLW